MTRAVVPAPRRPERRACPSSRPETHWLGFMHVAPLLAASLPLPLAAQASTPRAGDVVVLSLEACDAFGAEAVRELVALELAPSAVVLAPAQPTPAQPTVVRTQATVRCADDRAELRVHDVARPAPLALELELASTPEAARLRLVALTLSELVVTSRMERGPPPTPPEGDATPDANAVHGSVEPPRSALWLAATVVGEGEPIAASFGPELGVQLELGPVALLGSARVHWGTHSIRGTDVHTRALSVALAPALSLTEGSVHAFFGGGVELGQVQLEASTVEAGSQGRSVSGLWHAPLLIAGAHLDLSRALALHASVDVGYVTRPVRGLDLRDPAPAELYGHAGLRVGGGVGVAFRLP